MSNVKPKRIICVVGRSGSGKTTWMEHFRKYAYVVSSRTTRQAREGEVHGEAPYHKFLSANDYLSDAIVDGLVTTGNLSRGDDIILADTQFGDNTYWAKISDILSPTAFNGEDSIIDKDLVFYIIDPAGVVSLQEKQKKVAHIIDRYGLTKDQAPLLWDFKNSEIISMYVSADREIIDTVNKERKNRDDSQELGWRFIAENAQLHLHTDYIDDLIERESYLNSRSVSFIAFLVADYFERQNKEKVTLKTVEKLKEFWDDYQEKAWRTCLPSCQNWEYLCAGLSSEVGEVMDKIKKKIRGDYDDCPEKYTEGLKGEISDCLWYFYSMMTLKGVKISQEALKTIGFGNCCSTPTDLSHYSIVSNLLKYAHSYCQDFDFFSRSGVMTFVSLLYSLAHLATALGFTLEEAAEYNIKKLAKRYSEDKIMGAGDYR